MKFSQLIFTITWILLEQQQQQKNPHRYVLTLLFGIFDIKEMILKKADVKVSHPLNVSPSTQHPPCLCFLFSFVNSSMVFVQ